MPFTSLSVPGALEMKEANALISDRQHLKYGKDSMVTGMASK